MKKTLFLVGFGASLMYFFDPKNGETRRNSLRDTFESFLPQTKKALGQKADEVVAKAHEITSKVDNSAAETIQGLGENALHENSANGSAPGNSPNLPSEVGHS